MPFEFAEEPAEGDVRIRRKMLTWKEQHLMVHQERLDSLGLVGGRVLE